LGATSTTVPVLLKEGDALLLGSDIRRNYVQGRPQRARLSLVA
jgi:hypothetical protein